MPTSGRTKKTTTELARKSPWKSMYELDERCFIYYTFGMGMRDVAQALKKESGNTLSMSPSEVKKRIDRAKAARDRYSRKCYEEHHDMAVARVEALLPPFFIKARGGDPVAAGVVLKSIDTLIRLHALDRQEQSVIEPETIIIDRGEYEAGIAEGRAAMKGIAQE